MAIRVNSGFTECPKPASTRLPKNSVYRARYSNIQYKLAYALWVTTS